MAILNEIFRQIIAIFTAISFFSSVALRGLNPPVKRLGYALLLPAVLIGFGHLFLDGLDAHTRTSLTLYGFAMMLLVLTITRHSFHSDQQMIGFSVVFTGLYAFVLRQYASDIRALLVSPAAMAVLIALNLTLVFLVYKQRKTHQDWLLISGVFVTALGLSYEHIGIFAPLVYGIGAIAMLLFTRSIYTDYRYVHEQQQLEIQRIEKDFDLEVEKEVRRRTFHLERSKKHVLERSRTDSLTKALTKKALLDLMEDFFHDKRIQKYSILMFDIDKFKTLNDTYGHITGDKCLKTMVKIAMDTIRDDDEIGRYGGDEFFIVLPNQNAKEAKLVAERFRENVLNNTNPPFSVSIGIATYPWDGESTKELIAVADQGLYKAKELGRNRVSYTGYLKIDEPVESSE